MIAIIQARYSSKRLPGKVLLKIMNKTILEHIVYRLKKSSYIKKIVIATSTSKSDNNIYNAFKKK